MAHPMFKPAIICWQCDDPTSNYRVELTMSELVQHTIIFGSTGSGKSTLLIDATRQLIAYQAQSPKDKIGLLILDAKADDLVVRVREAARQAGRTSDVLVFGPSGDCSMDLFGALQGQAHEGRIDPSALLAAERVTRQVLLGLDRFGGDNAFWWQATTAMLNSGFTLLAASEQKISFASAVEFLRRWFFSPETPSSLWDLVKRIEAQGGRRHPALAAAVDQVRLFHNLDVKTKSNLQSCLVLALQPLVSAAAVRCFSPRSGNVSSPAQAATENRLAVVSVNAMAEPDVARFFFRLAAQLFFDSVQQRRQPAPLAGIILDEAPLVITPEFAPQLATIRSKNSFVLAAAQSVQSLSERVGIAQSRAVLNNFNTTIFMRNREAETAGACAPRIRHAPRAAAAPPPTGRWVVRTGLAVRARTGPDRGSGVPGRCVGATLATSGLHRLCRRSANGIAGVVYPLVRAGRGNRPCRGAAAREVHRQACGAADGESGLLSAVAGGGRHTRLRVEAATTAHDHAARIGLLPFAGDSGA